jgi:hypothetical protein
MPHCNEIGCAVNIVTLLGVTIFSAGAFSGHDSSRRRASSAVAVVRLSRHHKAMASSNKTRQPALWRYPFKQEATMKTRFWIATLIALALASPARAADTKTLLAELIRLNGYDCPEVRTITAEGSDHRGKVFKVWCGGHSGTNAWNVKAIEFRLTEIGTPRSLGYDVLVSPWRD